MKRRTIITSVLVIVLCLGLISGSTFALFTSESKVNIAVTSGKVNVVATLKDLAVYSANANASELTADEKADEAGTLTGTFAGTYYYDQLSVENNEGVFANGGKATLAANLLTLDRITPGDKVSVKVDVENNSNVAIQYRVRVNVLEDENAAESYKLFKGLKVTIGKDEAKKDLNSTILTSEWTPLAAEAEITGIPVKIYLPLDAGNEYQGLTTKLVLTVEAVQGNANTSTLAGINAILKASTDKKNATMYDAIQELAGSYPYSILKEYVWSVDNDLFYVESDVESSFEYRFFKAYKAMPEEQTFSIYADPSWNATEVDNLTVGFDAGVTTDITSITYNRSTAEYGQDVVIRTNSAATTLTINAPKDTINHYGTSGNVNIVAVAGSSYHENGKVAFVEIANGRLALEKDSKVSRIHFVSTEVEQGETTDKVFNEIIVSYDSSLENKLPEFSRDNVEIPTQGKLVVELQKVDNTQPEPEATSDFIWLTKQGIFEQIKVSEDGEKISESAKWADDGEVDDDTQKASFQIANNIGRDTNGDVSTNVTVNNVGYTVTLNETTRELVVTNSDSNPVPASTVVTESGLNNGQKEDIKQKEIKKLTVNSIFADYLKIETVTGEDILPNGYDVGLKEDDIKSLYASNKDAFNKIVYGVYYDDKETADDSDDKLLLQNGRSYIAVDEDSYKQDDEKYRYWHGDFVISFNKDISAFDEEKIGNNIILAGEYGDWGWLKFPLVDGLAANTKLRLLNSYMGGIITINYEELCTTVKEFKCGAAYIAPEGYDTSDPLIITIEFRLYETSDNPTTHNEETGYYIIVDTYQYIFN